MVVAEAAPEGVEHHVRVLVADDEPGIRHLLAAALAPQGYEVTAASDGDEAKLLLEREPFEIVITDYQMPGLNGIDILRFAKLMNAGCQVVVITGRDGPGIQEKAIAYGAADYIQKPFSLDAITRAMASLPNEAVEREQAATESQAALAEKDEEIEELQAALSRSLSEPDSRSSPDDRVLRYLRGHPQGADFDTLESATGVRGREIVQTMARLLDAGKARREFPLFFAAERGRAS